MSTRLQVVVDERELKEFQSVARAHHLTLAEWVRQALRRARREQPATDAHRKIQCVREAVACEYPTGDIEPMLEDIERGRREPGES